MPEAAMCKSSCSSGLSAAVALTRETSTASIAGGGGTPAGRAGAGGAAAFALLLAAAGAAADGAAALGVEAAGGDAPDAGVVADGVDGAVEAGVFAGLTVDAPAVDGIFGGADEPATVPDDGTAAPAEFEAELVADTLL